MTCIKEFEIDDGTTVLEVRSQSLSESYEITREFMSDGVDQFLASEGTRTLWIRFKHYRYTIAGTGPGDPDLWSLDIAADTWTVTIPGFKDGSEDEIWTVLPAYPRQTRNKRAPKGQQQSWSLNFVTAAAQ